MKTMQELSKEYSELCTRLGDIVTKIDLFNNDMTEIKTRILEINKEALAVREKEEPKEAKLEAVSS